MTTALAWDTASQQRPSRRPGNARRHATRLHPPLTHPEGPRS
ncbi:hypothetical protein [Streptomyces albidoflavus]|nr:hypothetical protein [Streptomyces albidoflavus]